MSNSARKLLGATAAAEDIDISDYFSTYLYTGNGSTQTITNGIDLAGEGGLVWIKQRSSTADHILMDSERGVSKVLYSNLTSAESSTTWGTSFNSDGFNFTTASGYVNGSGSTYASWTFRKAPRFFDVVTYTGTGANRTVAHNLGVVPGCIIIKETSAVRNWYVYHRSTGNTKYLNLNLTDAAATSSLAFNNTDPTATEFTVGTINGINNSGATYVAYLFAHDPLGPSGDGSDGLIACGSYTGNTTTKPDINLGWEPQWVLIKAASGTNAGLQNWALLDSMRGFTMGVDARLQPNTSDAEASYDDINPTPTGFTIGVGGNRVNENGSTYIYIAIRRGPMREPTSGTEVFAVDNLNNPSTSPAFISGFPVDMALFRDASSTYDWETFDRLRGTPNLRTNSTTAELTSFSGVRLFDFNNGFYQSGTTTTFYSWMFRRAPGFFDVVAYTGDGTSNRQVNHNLGVVPELVITKIRSGGTGGWWTRAGLISQNQILRVDQTGGFVSFAGDADTSTTFNSFLNNDSGTTNIAYLFATLAGVSKVGSYTGNGSNQTINCGFTGGARFVLIKRTSATGDWYVWDTARGIVAGNDPHLSLNTTAAEVTTNDSIDPDSSGFIVNQVAATNINVSSASYIYLAIA